MKPATNWKSTLRRVSRSRRFLWKMSLGIIALGLAGSFAINFMPRAEPPVSLAAVKAMIDDMRDFEPPDDYDPKSHVRMMKHVIELLRSRPDLIVVSVSRMPAETLDDMRRVVRDSSLNAQTQRVALAALDNLVAAPAEPTPDVLAMAGADPPPAAANLVLAMHRERHGDRAGAIDACERELRYHPTDVVQTQLAELYRLEGREEDARRVEPMNSFEGSDPRSRWEAAVDARDWLAVLLWALPAQHWPIDWLLTALAAAVGAMWLLFCVRAAQPASAFAVRTWLCAAAVVLGVLSIAPTLLAIVYEEQVWNLTFTGDLVGGLVYCIAGIGLREELCKLLLFVPLAPILVRRGNELEMLMAAGCVGLGFAAEENIGYFHGFGAVSAPGRFLTANFFHIASTGILGLYLCRAIRWPGRWAGQFGAAFILMVLVHGMYDALIMVPALTDYSIFSGTVFILLGYWFFHELRGLRIPNNDTVSLTAVFLFGTACTVALSFMYMSHLIGLKETFKTLAPATLGVSLFLFMYLRELPDTLYD